MLKPHTIFATFFLLILSITNAQAQGDSARSDKPEAPTITVTASGERVRFTAPSSVVQTRLEVYDSTGKKVFDNEVRGGNVIDWRLQDGQAGPLADDTYLCAITVKSLSGKITQRIGSVTIQQGSATVRAADASKMTAQQSQAIGPLDENASLSVVSGDENLATTVIAHNGTEGQIVRGSGALTFRLGDFFSGKDREQMRLTAEGNFGIGISNPQAMLDVDGLIRSNQGIVFPDGSIQLSAARRTYGAASKRPGQFGDHPIDAQGEDSPITPSIAGTGTTGQIPKWQNGPSGILSDSVISELNGSIGIGEAPNPTYKLDVLGHNRFRGANVSFYLTGSKAGGNEWLFQTVDADGRLRIFENSTGGGERFSLSQNGNVGIGVSVPAVKLDVAGSINAGGNVNALTQYNIGGMRVMGTGGNFNNIFVGVSAGSSSNTGINNSFFGGFSGANNTSGGQNSFFGKQSGMNNHDGVNNSFLGESSGLNNTSGSFNTFVGAFAGTTNNNGANNTIVGDHANLATGSLTNATAIGALASVSQSNSLVLGSINGVNFATSDTNVGIGTTAPANTLDVNGAGTQSGGVAGFGEVVARFRQRPAAIHSAVSIDALTGQDPILYLAENGAAVWGIRNDSDQGGKFQIRFQSGGVNRTNFSLNPTGEIGIGTTTPNATLQISSSLTEQVLSAFSDLTTGTWFNLGNTSPGGRTWNIYSSGSSNNEGAGKLVIRDNNASTVRVALDSFGNFGIGIANPNDRLHVVGDIRIGTGTTGCVKDADGTVLTGTCSSDARFKRDITPFPKVLDQLVRLRPVNFYWRATEYPEKAFGSSRSFGLIAQDVEQVLPELVTEDENGFKAVRYNKLPLLMLQGLKELKADNDSVRRENDALKQTIEALGARLRKLETSERRRRRAR